MRTQRFRSCIYKRCRKVTFVVKTHFVQSEAVSSNFVVINFCKVHRTDACAPFFLPSSDRHSDQYPQSYRPATMGRISPKCPPAHYSASTLRKQATALNKVAQKSAADKRRRDAANTTPAPVVGSPRTLRRRKSRARSSQKARDAVKVSTNASMVQQLMICIAIWNLQAAA